MRKFLYAIQGYLPVLTQPTTTPPPPVIIDITLNEIQNLLSVYTLKEIIDAYQIIKPWYNRDDIYVIILRETRIKWQWNHNNCNNDDTFNVIEGDPHGDINKDDSTDPTLSYGLLTIHYQVLELAASFREYDGIFRFLVPDWIPPNPAIGREPIIDSITNTPLIFLLTKLRNYVIF